MILKTIESIFRKALPLERYLFNKYCRRLALNLDYQQNREGVNIFSEVLVHKAYAPYFPFYEKSVIVDVGAYYGYFSFFAAMNTSPESRIIALEPSPTNFQQLQLNLSGNSFKNIEAVEIAIGDKSGQQHIYGGRSYNHSLFSDSLNASPIATGKILSLADFMDEYNVSQIDFLKLDCEGAEYPVLLKSDAKTLSKVTTISMEFHDLRQQGYRPQQLLQHLHSCGFEIVEYSFSPNYSGTLHNFGKIVATRSAFNRTAIVI